MGMTSETADLFAKLLSEPVTTVEGDICLVTGAPLEENYVTLSCGHKFNYTAMFAELKQLRAWGGRPYDTNYVTTREMRCPYCRAVTKGVLPYVPSIIPQRVNGLNAPQSFCTGQSPCAHLLLRGTRKGHACGKAGFIYKGKAICPLHWKVLTATKPGDSEWTPQHERARRVYSCAGLRELLKANGLPTSGTKKVLVSRLLEKEIPL